MRIPAIGRCHWMKIYEYKKNNSGFIHLDYVFEQNFKRPLQQRDPEFYDKIKNLSIEEFVSEMMSLRKELDSFNPLPDQNIMKQKNQSQDEAASVGKRLWQHSVIL